MYQTPFDDSDLIYLEEGVYWNPYREHFEPTPIKKDLALEEEKAWQEFIERHGEVKGYAHFDKRVSLKNKFVQKLVCDQDWVKHHGFFPLIKYTIKTNNTNRNYLIGMGFPLVITPCGFYKKDRDIFYASHLDNCIYQRYAYLINKAYLEYINAHDFAQAVAGYRSDLGLSNIDFAKQVFDFIQQQTEDVVIIRGDFYDFFNSLNHDYLKNKLCRVLGTKLPADYYAVFRSVIQYDYVNYTEVLEEFVYTRHKTDAKKDLNKRDSITSINAFHQFKKHHIFSHSGGTGIPQGVAISPILSNVYMIDFDKTVNRIVKLLDGMYLRYSDDFIIIIPIHNTISTTTSTPSDSLHILEKAGQYINMLLDEIIKTDIGLNLNLDKTHCMVLQQNQHQLYAIDNIIEKYLPGFSEISPYICNDPCYLDFLGFRFDGKNIKVHPHIITNYYKRLRQKALTIVKNNWKSPKGNRISAKNLYRMYSNDRNEPNIVRYLQRCKFLLKLNDPEAEAIINNSKHKIAVTINRLEHKKQIMLKKKKRKEKFARSCLEKKSPKPRTGYSS